MMVKVRADPTWTQESNACDMSDVLCLVAFCPDPGAMRISVFKGLPIMSSQGKFGACLQEMQM